MDVDGFSRYLEFSPLALLFYCAILLGPLSLIVGSWLILGGGNRALGAVFIIGACLFLTATVTQQLTLGFDVQPLQVKPSMLFYSMLAGFVALTDLAALGVVYLLTTYK